MISGSNLERVLSSGQFAVTGELGPPKNSNYEVIREKARILKGHVDAVNITDCQTAIVRMSSLTAALIALSEGVEPVMQMTCRDRNRIGMQADILGASALGIRNLLCLTGDHQKFGNHPQSKGVFDMDSIQLLGMVRAMRDEHRFQCGEEIKGPEPKLFLGAAANPFADPFEYRPLRLAKKVDAGAGFVQTQIIYNVEKFRKFMEMVRDLGLDEKVYILAGVTPPKSLGMARYMKNFVPGLDVTDDVIQRLSDARDPREEGINICVDIINQVKEIPGVAGVHVMAIEWEQAVPEIVSRAGLSKRPEPAGIQPALVSSDAIDEAVAQAREQAEATLREKIEKVKAEAQASRDLVVKEKERVAGEIYALKTKVEELTGMVKNKDAQVKELTAELKEAKTAAVTVQQAAPAAPASGQAAAPVAAQLGAREQAALRSLGLGLDALRKALGLDEAQYEALKRFLEAEFLLHFNISPAPVQPAGEPVPGPVPTTVEPAVQAQPQPEALQAPEEAVDEEAERRHKQVVRLVAKGNLLLHKQDYSAAIEAFEQALEIDSEDPKAKDGLQKAKAAAGAQAPEAPAGPAEEGGELLPPCPDELTPDEWKFKWVVRWTGRGNVALYRGEQQAAIDAFKKALSLDPENEKARDGLKKAEAGELGPGPEETKTAAETPEPGQAPVEAAETPESAQAPVEAAPAEPAPPKVDKPVPEPAAPAPPKVEKKAPAVSAAGAPAAEAMAGEKLSLSERASGIPEDLFVEKCTGRIQEVVLGEGDNALRIGGAQALPFHVFEGDVPNPPQVAYEILDFEPEEWPEPLAQYYKGEMSDPVAWARKCVDEYKAKAICLSLLSTDPNGMNRSSAEAAQVAQKVVEAVDVPVIIWGCNNAEKDTETLREVTNLVGTKKVCLSPLTDANYRALGATAMAFQLPVVAATPIDVNLAKQLNILLENLGMQLNQVLMDPSIGAVGYGLEYSYSVMERITLAALTQQDDKLSVPFICNLGREVWKAKECRLPSDDLLGDQERRGVLLEAITASSLLLAGGGLMVMRHPRAIALTEALIQGMM